MMLINHYDLQPCDETIVHNQKDIEKARNQRKEMKRVVECRRSDKEHHINEYNPLIMYLWRGNMDIQFIGSDNLRLAM